MQSRNPAARIGRWSAQHRKTAILGWILFVVLATVLGGKVGQNDLDDSARGSGESKRGDMIIKAAGFPDQAGEQVLVQGTRHPADRRRPGRRESPEADRGRHRDRAPAPLRGRPLGRRQLQARRHGRAGREARRRPLAAVAAVQAAHPGVRVEQFGDASAAKAIAAQDAKDGKKSERISYALLLIILLVAFGALVAAGVPLVLGATAVAATVGLLGPVSQLYALPPDVAELVVIIGLAVGVDYAMFYSRRDDGGARPRPLGRGRGRDRRRHLGPRGAHLRPDRDHRDGRAAVRRQPDLRRLRHRHDARRRRRRDRLDDVPARDARVPEPRRTGSRRAACRGSPSAATRPRASRACGAPSSPASSSARSCRR